MINPSSGERAEISLSLCSPIADQLRGTASLAKPPCCTLLRASNSTPHIPFSWNTAFTITELLLTTKKMCASNWKSLFGWALSENSEESACCCSRGSSPAHSPWEQEENETPNVSWKCLAPLCCSLSLNSSCSHSKCKLEASFATYAAQKIPFLY